MVRLKVIAAINNVINLIFQFQYGTIKRYSFLIPKIAEVIFQFQYGTIKSMKKAKTYSAETKFQFQYGTIKSGCFVLIFKDSSISIPVWYD